MKNAFVKSIAGGLVLVAAVMGLLAGRAEAATLYWSGNGTTLGGVGTWDTSNNRWSSSYAGPFSTAWVNANKDTARFASTAGSVTLAANIDVGGLWFDTTAYTLTTTGYSLNFTDTGNSITFNNIAAATITGPVGGSGNVTLTAANSATAGTLTLNGTSTGGWSGTTTINAGMTLSLSGLNQGLASTTGGITLNGGGITLTSADSTVEDDLDRVSNGTAILSNGGTITYTTTTAGSAKVFAETIGSVALTSGQLNIVESLNKTAGSQTLTLAGLTRAGAANSSAITLSNAGGLNITNDRILVSGASATPGGVIIGPWATAGTAANNQTDYAVYDASGYILPANITASAETTWTTAANAYTLSGTTTLTGTRTITALRNTGATATLTLASGFNLQTYGVLNGAATMLTIAPGNGGVLTTPTGGGNLYLTTHGVGTSTSGAHNGITVTAPINNNGSDVVTLVKSGVGVLQLNATSSYSGGTVLNSGTLWAQSNASLGDVNGDITFNGSATLLIATGTGTGGTFFTLPSTRSIIVNNGAMATIAAGKANANPGTINSDISGTGGVTVGRITLLSAGGVGNYNFELLGNNTFTGELRVGTGLETSAAGANNGLRINTLADSTSPITLNFGDDGYFDLKSTAPANLSVPNRPINLLNSNLTINNLSGTRTMTLGAVSTSTSSAQTLKLGAGGAGGVVAGAISNGSGTISVTVNGTGAWTLSGASTYSGVTTLTAGTLRLGANSVGTVAAITSSPLGIGSLTLTSGTLSSDSSTARTVLNAVTFGGNVTLGDATRNGTLTFSNTAALGGATRTLTVSSPVEFAGVISSTGVFGITKAGTSTLALSGTNTYSGVTTISGGTLVINSITNVSGGGSSLGAPATVPNGTVAIGATTAAGTLAYTGTGHTSDRVINLAGTTGGATLDQSGSGLLKFTSAFTATGAGAKTLTLQGSTAGVGEIAGAIVNSSSATSLAKSGTGTWVLSGNNTYTGITTNYAGTLLATKAAALPGYNSSGKVSVVSGATLAVRSGGAGEWSSGEIDSLLGATTAAFASGSKFGVDVTTGNTFIYANDIGATRAAKDFVKSGAGTLALSGVNTYTGTTTVDAGTLQLGSGGTAGSLDASSAISLSNAATFAVNRSDTVTLGAPFSGSGGFSQVGGGTTIMTATNTYAGPTTVDAGKLLVNGSITGSVSVASGAYLGGMGGAITGNVAFATGALALFTNDAPLRFAGSVALDNNVIHLALPDNLPAGDYVLATNTSGSFSGLFATVPVLDSGSFMANTTPSITTRVDSVVLEVEALAVAVKLAIIDVNGGTSPTAGVPYSVTVQAQDAGGTPQNVTGDTGITLSMDSGTAGSLGGTLTGTIPNGQNSVTITDVTNSVAEAFTLQAETSSGMSLVAGTSGYTVNPASAATFSVTGFPAVAAPGASNNVTVTALDAYGNTDINYAGTVTLASSLGGASFVPATPYTFLAGDAGVKTFSVALNTFGLQNLTASGTGPGSPSGQQTAILVAVPTSFYWTNSASGNWSVTNNWTNDLGWIAAPVTAGQTNYTLNFNNADTYTATHDLDPGFLLNQLNFGGATATLAGASLAFTNNGAALPQVNQNSAAAISIGNDLILGVDTAFGGSGAGTVTVAGAMSGAGGLTKTGTGMLAIAGTNNTYSGATEISGGTVKLGSSAFAVAATTQTFTSDANSGIGTANSLYGSSGYNLALAFNQGADLNINGVTFKNTGTAASGSQGAIGWSLSNWGNNSASGSFPTGFQPVSGQQTYSLFNHFYYGSGGAGYTQTMTLTGLTPGQAYDARIYYRSWGNPVGTRVSTWTFNPGVGSPTTLTSLNEDANSTGNYIDFTYTAGPAGTLTLSAVNAGAGSWHLYGFSNQSIPGLSVGNVPTNTTLSIATGATFDLGGNSQMIASLSDSGGGGTVTNSSSTSATLTINPSAGSPTFSGAIRGPLSLVKTGIATQVLAGASAYTGGTTVSNGTLLVNGSITGAVNVISGATLGGTGAITGNVTFATGALALFTHGSPMTFTGPVALNDNTVYLALPSNLPEGTYLLATNTTSGFTGTFAAEPEIASGSVQGLSYIVTDAGSVSLVVSATAIITITPATLPAIGLNLAYSQTLTASGGTAPYGFTVSAGALPDGLSLSTAGELSGTPTTAGTSTFTVQAEDADHATGHREYSLTVEAPAFFWSNAASGNWDSTGNWTNEFGASVAPSAAGRAYYSLNFNKAGTYTATHNLTNGFLLNQLNFGGATATLAGASMTLTNNGATPPRINQNSGVAVSIGNAMVLGANTTLGGSGGGTLTLSGAISGAGSLTKTTSGALTLSSGASTFTGGTTISGGSLTISANANLGASGSRNLTFTGSATLNGFNSASLNALVVNGGTVTISANTMTFTSTSGSGSITYNGFGNANVQLDLGNASAFTGTLRNNIGGHGSNNPGKLIQFTSLGDGVGSSMQFGGGEGDGQQAARYVFTGDAGSLTMTNRQVQFYAKPAGGNSFNRAILQNDNGTPANKWVILPNLANTTDRAHYFELRGSNTGDNEFAGTIINSTNGGHALSLNKVDVGKWILSGNNTYSGTTTISGGTLQIGAGGASGTLGSGNVVNNATLTFNRTGTYTVSNAISGSGSVNINGSGTVAFQTADTYAGATTVNAGMLLVNGSLASVVTVNSGGTLGGTGPIAGASASRVKSGATLSPGNTVGTLMFSNGLTLDSGSTLALGLGTLSDLLRVSGGNFTAPSSGTVQINITSTGDLEPGDYTLIDWTGATPSNVNVEDFVVAIDDAELSARAYIQVSNLIVAIRPRGSVFRFR